MDNIEVLLKAAEYIDAQENLGHDSKTPNHLNIDSSLSPISSVSYSSSSSSLINSPNNANNSSSAKNDSLFHKTINSKKKQNSFVDNSTIYSSSLPSNFICTSKLSKIKKDDEIKSIFNKSLSRLEEMKRDKAIHNTLEKNRRAHLKGCFESLQNELPQYKDKKCTNLAILNYTLKFIEMSKKKNKENELEKKRLLEEQFKLKNKLSQIALDFKEHFLKQNANSMEDAENQFNSLLKSLNIDDDLLSVNDKNDWILDCSKNDYDQNSNITATSPKQIVAKYYRKRSSNSLSIITGIKTVQPTQSLQLQLQNQLKLQKSGKRLNSQNRHRHYSVDDNIMNRQRNRKKTVSTYQNDFESNFDEENDGFDDYNSTDEISATQEFEMDSNSWIGKDNQDSTTTIDDDEESRDLIINEEDEEIKKLSKDEPIDIETLSDKSGSPLNDYNSDLIHEQSRITLKKDEKNSPTNFRTKFPSDLTGIKMEKAASNLGYITKSLIPNVRNLNLKTINHDSSSENICLNNKIKLTSSFFQKQNQNNLKPKQ